MLMSHPISYHSLLLLQPPAGFLRLMAPVASQGRPQCWGIKAPASEDRGSWWIVPQPPPCLSGMTQELKLQFFRCPSQDAHSNDLLSLSPKWPPALS